MTRIPIYVDIQSGHDPAIRDISLKADAKAPSDQSQDIGGSSSLTDLFAECYLNGKPAAESHLSDTGRNSLQSQGSRAKWSNLPRFRKPQIRHSLQHEIFIKARRRSLYELYERLLVLIVILSFANSGNARPATTFRSRSSAFAHGRARYTSICRLVGIVLAIGSSSMMRSSSWKRVALY